MLKLFYTLLLVLFVASCGIMTPGSAPRNLDNACSIVQQRPQYLRAFKATERKWGVPINVQMAVIHQESRFKKAAKTPRKYFLGIIPSGRQSSAYGFAQALDGTWSEYKRSTGRFAARRSSIRDAADFIGWYMTETKRRSGVALSDARNQYLAYHEGQGGFMRGTHLKKPWLLAIADKVANRSSTYRRQLKSCGKI